jgi:selenocysteine lyase/cysteine desulfurase
VLCRQLFLFSLLAQIDACRSDNSMRIASSAISARALDVTVRSFDRNGRRFASSSLSTKVAKEGYQSIGSFHSDNLADLMAMSDEEYVPPSLPFGKESLGSSRESDSDFLLDLDEFTFLNHGAFGAALTVGYDRAAAWRRYTERQPLRYFDRDLLPHLAYSARRLADFAHAPKQHVTLTVNATAGLNSVLAGYAREFGDAAHVILWDTSYGSVKKMAQHYCGSDNMTEIPLQQDCYLDQLATSKNPTDVLQQALDDAWHAADLQGKRPLLILDHTTSNTALTFPVELLAKQVKDYDTGALVLVDGAHGLLAQDVNVSNMPNVDFYISNGHKWLCTPRGVAMLYAKPEWHDTVLRRPAVISHGVDEPDLFSRYVWDGSRDYAAALSLPVVLDYWKEKNPNLVRKQIKNALGFGIHILAEAWHPDSQAMKDWPGNVTLTKFDSSMLSPMALVRLPDRFGIDKTSTDAKLVQDFLYSQNVELPVKCVQGKLYVRVSCHVYNGVGDFEILADAINRFPSL